MPEADLKLLIEAAQASGNIASKYWQKDPEIWDKADGAGPVTQADLEIDTMLREELCAARPEYGWLSEETTDTTVRLGRDRVFIVDPIDGTRAFINGSPTFAHSLAVAEKGVIIAAVVYLPMLERLFAAQSGGGATLNGERIFTSDCRAVAEANILAAASNMQPEYWATGIALPTRHFRSSLAYRLSLVGQGRFDAMLTLRATWEWDVAAGTLITQEAGGLVSDAYGQAALFNNPRPQLSGLVAAGAHLHPLLCADLRAPAGL